MLNYSKDGRLTGQSSPSSQEIVYILTQSCFVHEQVRGEMRSVLQTKLASANQLDTELECHRVKWWLASIDEFYGFEEPEPYMVSYTEFKDTFLGGIDPWAKKGEGEGQSRRNSLAGSQRNSLGESQAMHSPINLD